MIAHLDENLLRRFERALEGVNAAITRVWAPGLSDTEIDGQIEPHGLVMPEEARRWWRWHNGCVPQARGPHWDLTPGRPLYDLAMAIDSEEPRRAVGMPGRRLEFVGDQPWILFECSVEADAPVPIYTGGHGEEERLVLPSIGELVKTWACLIEDGHFRTASDGTWENIDFEALPPDVVELGVF